MRCMCMTYLFKNNIIKSIIILAISLICYLIIQFLISKTSTKLFGKRVNNKKKTYFILLNSIVRYFIVIITLLIILDVNGINISSLVTGLGIIGIIVGLAVQDALKDVIMGKNIITGHFFEVGDVIKYKDITGKVLSIGLKSTKIRDIYTNNIMSITNRNIDQIITLSEWLDIDIPVPYEKKSQDIQKILEDIILKIKKIENIENCDIQGINEFASSSIIYKIRIYCLPELAPKIKRQCLGIIKENFDINNLSIP